MELTYPTAFWGLLGFLIPLIVLLLSKQKQQIIEFGSLAFLEETESRSARSIFPTQWPLFLLRILIISLLVILLAQPYIKKIRSGSRILIEKSVYEDEAFSEILAGFDKEPEIFESTSLWLLIRQLNQSGDSAVVYSRSYEKDFIGQPAELNSRITWNTVPHDKSLIRYDTVLINKKALVAEIISDEGGLFWNQETIEEKIVPKMVKVRIEASEDKQAEKQRLIALLNSFELNLPLAFDFESEDGEWFISIDTSILQVNKNIIEWNDFDGGLNLQEKPNMRYVISGDLTLDNLKSSNFSVQLAQVFLYDQLDVASLDRRTKTDFAVVDEQQDSEATIEKTKKQWYWYTPLLLLLLLERWYSRKLEAA